MQTPDDPTAAPILDKQVADWLLTHAGVALQLGRTSSCESYLQLLTLSGNQHNRTTAQIEKAIFGLATGRD